MQLVLVLIMVRNFLKKEDPNVNLWGHILSFYSKLWGNLDESVSRQKNHAMQKIMTTARFELAPPKRPGKYGKVTLPWRLRPLGQVASNYTPYRYFGTEMCHILSVKN